ncbi:MAG: ABC transporter substrate-binding protein [Coriobacteriales bacterium]|nr:ABC transporter substrate-binding protein [Coriobacteriales bacterium]
MKDWAISRRFSALLLALVMALSLFVLPLVGCRSAGAKDEGVAEATEGENEGQTTEGSRAPVGPVTFTDDLGTQITVDDPQRVVCGLSSFAETWQLAGGSVIAVPDDALTQTHLTFSPDIATIGAFNAPNLEAIVALEPDLVLLSAATPQQLELQASLTEIGIPVAFFEVTHFEDYLRMLKVCTDITGRSDLYELNGLATQERIDALKAQVPATTAQGEKPRAIFLITYSQGTRVQDGTTMPGRMLVDLGCVNIADENPSLLKDFSLEALIEEDPDFIFLLPLGNDPEAAKRNLDAAVEGNPAWENVSAVKSGNYITVDAEHFSYKPCNRWDASYQILLDILYR